MAACERSELAGQGEGEQEVGHRQLQFVLFFQPALCVLVLALGAMPIAVVSL
jgi:hypothetical protein